jgi:pimeloyl-ACP methyl ester carboxylesterase
MRSKSGNQGGHMKFSRLFGLLLLMSGTAYAQPPPDSSPHKVQFVDADTDVKLEVLDWGGSGPPMIFLAGNGGTAHVFDDFVPNFTAKHHVFGITRRGFGNSSKPLPVSDNYGPDRLSDDILAVMAAMGINNPILVGHSIAGEELSSIGTRHPEKVAGLIYLDGAYEYAFYDEKLADGSTRYGADVAIAVTQRNLQRLSAVPPSEGLAIIAELQDTLPKLSKILRWYGPQDTVAYRVKRPEVFRYVDAVMGAERKFTTSLQVPVLAIFAVPKDCKPECGTPTAELWAAQDIVSANAFEAGNPKARVVRLDNARHGIWRSNEADVLREMTAFMAGLPR